MSVSSCSSLGKKNGGYAKIPETYSNKMPVFEPATAAPKKTKDDFGVLEIKQDGPGYEINLALDTGDENVNFVMDLPEQSSASKQLEQQDKQNSKPYTAGSKIEVDETPMPKNPENDFAEPEPEPLAQPAQAKTQTQLNQEKPEPVIVQQGPSGNDYLVSAQTQFYEDNYMGALSDIENAIEKDGTQALSFAIKGSILYKLGNKQAAKLAWEKALSLNPKLKSVELSLQYLVGQ